MTKKGGGGFLNKEAQVKTVDNPLDDVKGGWWAILWVLSSRFGEWLWGYLCLVQPENLR